MKLSVELLDHIFSFLVSHETLTACSEDPVLFPIVERYLYYHITVHFSQGWVSTCYSSDRFYKLISENPRILNYVRVLRIRVSLDHYLQAEDLSIKKALDRFAKTLLRFPVLECIVLDTPNKRSFCWPDDFQAALKDRLRLPTVKGLQIVGNQDFPCPLMDNCKNIENLLLSGPVITAEARVCTSTLPELKSLTLLNFITFEPLLPHIKELRSLKCARFSVQRLSGLLGVCSQTLNKLDINLDFSLCEFREVFSNSQ